MGIKIHQYFVCIVCCYSLFKGSKGNGLVTGNFLGNLGEPSGMIENHPED